MGIGCATGDNRNLHTIVTAVTVRARSILPVLTQWNTTLRTIQRRMFLHGDHQHRVDDVPVDINNTNNNNSSKNKNNFDQQNLLSTNTTNSPTTRPPPSSSSSLISQRVSTSRRKNHHPKQKRNQIWDSHNLHIPSFKEFVHRSTVLSMYRNFFRVLRTATTTTTTTTTATTTPVATQENHRLLNKKELQQLQSQVRREFKLHQHTTTTNNTNTPQDSFSIQRAISEGKKRLEELKTYIGHMSSSSSSSSSSSPVETWRNTPNDDPPEDQRGRVGEGWPWQK
jgi:hypothetical protein